MTARKLRPPRRARTDFEPDVLDLPVNHDPWMTQAACAAIAPAYELFFPEDHLNPRRRRRLEAQAKGYCAVCPVAWQCLDHAITNVEVWGVWGGMTFQERCDLSDKYKGHTSPAARAAHRRHITELNRKKHTDVDRPVRLRP